MKKQTTRIIVTVLMIAGLSGTGYLFYHKLQLDRQIVGLEQTIEADQKKQRMLQKKYTEEKAKQSTCMRAKLAEESKNAALQGAISQLEEEKANFSATLAEVEKKYSVKIEKFEKKILKLEEYKEKLKVSRENLIGKYKILAQEDRKKARQIQELENMKQELISDLKTTSDTLERARKHNGRLCEISEELTKKYREKNGLHADPFTKIGMVELEHLIQTYIKQIDKEKIITQ